MSFFITDISSPNYTISLCGAFVKKKTQLSPTSGARGVYARINNDSLTKSNSACRKIASVGPSNVTEVTAHIEGESHSI